MKAFCVGLGLIVLAGAPLASAAEGGSENRSQPLLVEGDAYAKVWAPPVYPPELKAQKTPGEVVVNFVVEETGATRDIHVAKSSDPRFNDAVLAAVRAATFEPAVEQGRAVAQGVALTWRFNVPYNPPKTTIPEGALRPLPKTHGVAEFSPDPEYPPHLLEHRIDGAVDVAFEVEKDGKVGEVKVLNATHPDFVRPALDALARYKFKPAMQGDLAVKETKTASLTFEYEGHITGDKITPFQANALALDKPDTVSAQEICDKEPEILVLPDPVFPLDQLSSAKAGEVDVTFTVNERGLCEGITVGQATSPSCGASVAAALEATVFKPAMRGGQTVAVKMKRHYQFTPPAQAVEADEPADARLLRALRAGETIPGPKGIDGKLKPIWRAMPVYPVALREEHPDGTADIEFVIDQTGRARVPKIVSATREEFGWAAATAIAQWVFDRPTRGGQPTDVRVKIPVKFSPPAK